VRSIEIHLAQPRGFCAGVKRAIAIVERALAIHGSPIYVRHEIVHNRTVVQDLKRRGAVFVNSLEEVPQGATLIFSAHGVPRAVEEEAQLRGLKVFDATCPLVTKVHREVVKMHAQGKQILIIGHAGHPEVEGTMGQVPDRIQLIEHIEDIDNIDAEDGSLAYVTQTTISVDESAAIVHALRERFPRLDEPKKTDICYATQTRQNAVRELASRIELLLVIGSKTSSNSNRLKEVAEHHGTKAYLIENADALDTAWFEGVHSIGITAGASAPEFLVQELLTRLKALFPALTVHTMPETPEQYAFPMPKGLWENDLKEA